MKISKGVHKKLLNDLFFLEGMNPMTRETGLIPKKFEPLNKMLDAATAYEKIAPALEPLVDAEGKQLRNSKGDFMHRIIYEDNEVEFTPGEIVVLKELFDKQTKEGWPFTEAEAVKELNDIFYPPQDV